MERQSQSPRRRRGGLPNPPRLYLTALPSPQLLPPRPFSISLPAPPPQKKALSGDSGGGRRRCFLPGTRWPPRRGSRRSHGDPAKPFIPVVAASVRRERQAATGAAAVGQRREFLPLLARGPKESAAANEKKVRVLTRLLPGRRVPEGCPSGRWTEESRGAAFAWARPRQGGLPPPKSLWSVQAAALQGLGRGRPAGEGLASLTHKQLGRRPEGAQGPRAGAAREAPPSWFACLACSPREKAAREKLQPGISRLPPLGF